MEREVLVDAAKAGDKVILESADRALSGIAPMYARWDKLKIHSLCGHEFLEDFRAFVVESLELRA